jgi:hypothetical protein
MLLQKMCDRDSKVLLDTSVSVLACLAACADIGCDVVLKVNAKEFCAIAGVSEAYNAAVPGGKESSHPTPPELIKTAALSLKESVFAQKTGEGQVYIAITDGGHPGQMFSV